MLPPPPSSKGPDPKVLYYSAKFDAIGVIPACAKSIPLIQQAHSTLDKGFLLSRENITRVK